MYNEMCLSDEPTDMEKLPEVEVPVEEVEEEDDDDIDEDDDDEELDEN